MADASERNNGEPPRVTILGIGQMGLVCAAALSIPDPHGAGESPRARVTMWGHDEDECGALSQTRRSERLPGFGCPIRSGWP
ncbi:MAG: hypothetical protein R3B67_02605 [Phycisphaerales bacterium]